MMPAVALESQELVQRISKAVRWCPMPGPQAACFLSKGDVCLFGGAAGGGKSSLLAGIATTVAEHSLLVRREISQLVPLVDEIARIVGNRNGLNAQSGIWRLSGNRTIRLGGCKDEGDEYRYQGAARDFLGIDEAALLSESQARGLLAWVRPRPRKGETPKRTRAILASNPPTGISGSWLMSWFAPWLDPASPHFPTPSGQLRWIVMYPGGRGEEWVDGPEPISYKGETLYPTSRTFFPAVVSSNIFLRNSGYVATLGSLPEPLRSQLLHGSWLTSRSDDPWQVIPSNWLKLATADLSPPSEKLSQVGLDVSRGGADETIAALRFGRVVGPLVRIPSAQTTHGAKVADFVCRILSEHEAPEAHICIDASGVGSSVLDHLSARLPSHQLTPFYGAGDSREYDIAGHLKFSNARSAAWWSLRERLDPSGPSRIRLPNDQRLLADLATPSWSMTSRGTTLETKESCCKRLGRSTDAGDATVLATLRVYAQTWRR